MTALIGSNGAAPFSLSSATRSVSARRTTIEFWNVPANMFSFTNALAYPNMGRRVTRGEAGSALSKAATTSGASSSRLSRWPDST